MKKSQKYIYFLKDYMSSDNIKYMGKVKYRITFEDSNFYYREESFGITLKVPKELENVAYTIGEIDQENKKKIN